VPDVAYARLSLVYTQVHNILISMQAQRYLIDQYARHELNLDLSIYSVCIEFGVHDVIVH